MSWQINIYNVQFIIIIIIIIIIIHFQITYSIYWLF